MIRLDYVRKLFTESVEVKDAAKFEVAMFALADYIDARIDAEVTKRMGYIRGQVG